jgi:hypothetical protein
VQSISQSVNHPTNQIIRSCMQSTLSSILQKKIVDVISRLFVRQLLKKSYALYDYLRPSDLIDNGLGTVPSSTDRLEHSTSIRSAVTI